MFEPEPTQWYINYKVNGKLFQFGPIDKYCDATSHYNDIRGYVVVEECSIGKGRDKSRNLISNLIEDVGEQINYSSGC